MCKELRGQDQQDALKAVAEELRDRRTTSEDFRMGSVKSCSIVLYIVGSGLPIINEMSRHPQKAY